MRLQLKERLPIRQTLATIAAAALGAGVVPAAERGKIETSMLLYSESDRVRALEGIGSLVWSLKEGRTVGLKLTYDGLTGASPNGAPQANRIQTFTRPSGNGQYTVPAGETPLDDTFHDTRFGVDASLSQIVNRTYTLTLGGHFSTEYDYLSLGASAGISRDFNKKNTTVSISGAFTRDEISPEGGIPDPFAAMPPAGSPMPRVGSSDTKTVLDLVIGVTQVIDRKTLAQVNYSFSRSSGYMTDPYKILAVVENSEGADPGAPLDYVYENRPDSRTKHALYGRMHRYIANSAADVSYRYFWDDWGSQSHTVDLFYKQMLRGGHALEPHVRWYHQSRSDHYRPFLVDGESIPEFATADYRLADFTAYTIGMQYYLPLMPDIQLTVAGEYYIQRGDNSPPEVFGSLRDASLFPDLDVFMVRLGFAYGL